MEIITKFNVGDEVWLMHDNSPQKYPISTIKTTTGYTSAPHIEYVFSGNIIRRERELFTTLEELKESIFKNRYEK